MLSPLKGVERLSEELKHERNKAGQALQDRAKLKIEIEYLQQNNDSKDETINKMHEELFQANMEIEKLHKNIEDQKIEYYLIQDNLKNKDIEINNIYKEKLNYQIENESSVDILNQKELHISSLAIKIESLENRCLNKDETISQFKNDIQQIRKDLVQVEQEKVDIHQSYIELKQQHVELQSYVSSITMMEEGYNQTKTSNDGLRIELEQVHSTNASFVEKIRELNRQLSDKSVKESQLEDMIYKQQQEINVWTKELHDLEESREQISSRVQAEIDARDAAIERTEAAVRSRDFLEQQILELRDAHRDALNHSLSVEEQLTTARTNTTELQSEIIKLKDVIERSQVAMEESVGVQAMTMEIETLRNQLNEVRKQLIKRDIEDEAGVLAPRAVMDREQQGRQVYEKIIQELRFEVDKINVKFHESSRRCEEAMRKAARVEQLEEEIKMYKEMAKSVTLESQNAALSISEAVERSIKYSHEKHNIMHDLHRVESELQSAKEEIVREKEEVMTLREKMKLFHSGKILADKKVAENLAANSRLEATLEDFKQKYDRNIIELEKSKRANQEQSFQLSEVRLKLNEHDQLKNDNQSLSNKILSIKADFTLKEKDLLMQIDALEYRQDTIQRELDASREKVNIQKLGIEQLQNENIHLRSDLESCITERDRYKREATQKESLHNEQQLHELRRDLGQTITEWQGLEKEKSLKDKMTQQLQNEYNKEREKVALFKMQNGILEERLKVANHELSVLRGINVYHSSMQVELQSYRKDKAALLNSESSMNASSSFLPHTRTHTPDPIIDIDNNSTTSATPGDTYGKGKFSLLDMQAAPVESNTIAAAASTNYERIITPFKNNNDIDDKVVNTISRNSNYNNNNNNNNRNSSRNSNNNVGYMQAIEKAATASNESLNELSMKDLIGNDQAVITHFSNRKSELMDENKEDTLNIDVEDDEDQHYIFTLYSPKSKSNNSTHQNHNQDDHYSKYDNDIKSSSFSKPPPLPPQSHITDKERQEILAQRTERKAIRDKQLRDKIVKENNSKQRTDDYYSSLASSTSNGINRNNNIVHSLHNTIPIQLQASHLSNKDRNQVADGRGLHSNNSLIYNNRSLQRQPQQLQQQQYTTQCTPTLKSEVKLTPSPIVMARNMALQKPSKTDFDRARRLLSM